MNSETNVFLPGLHVIVFIGILLIYGCDTQTTVPSSSFYETTGLPPTEQRQIQPTPPECIPDWQCTKWTECSSSGENTRICKDQHACGVSTAKPSESQICTPESKIKCPDFSSLSERVNCQGNSCLFALLNGDGIAKTDEYILYPADATPGQTYPYSSAHAPCRQGSEKGENVNYFYCEGMYIIMKETDTEGNILSSTTSWVKLVVQNSQIIESICS